MVSSLLSAMSTVQSGLSAVNAQLQVTSANITNSGTEGYTKKTVSLTSASLGGQGAGVRISSYGRTTDTALYNTLMESAADTGYRTTQDDYMSQIMDIFEMSSSDNPQISEATSDFVNAWTALQAEPESNVAQQNVIEAGSALSDELQRVSSEIESMGRDCQNDISSSLEDLNAYLQQIQDYNLKIATATTTGVTTGDLEDERDQLLLKVSSLLDLTVLDRQNNQIALYTKSGYQLLDGASVGDFYYDGTDIVETDNPSVSLNGTMTGGSLQALTDLSDTSAAAAASTETGVGTFQKIRDQLDLIAQAFLDDSPTADTGLAASGEQSFAEAYNNATTEAGELSSGFFTGSTRLDFEVNAGILDGTYTIKEDAISDVVDALLDTTRSFSTSGLSITGASYTTLVTGAMTDIQQTANSISSLAQTATGMNDYLTEKYTNLVGVSVDDEMLDLVTLQNIYTANARVLSTVQEMFQTLEQLV